MTQPESPESVPEATPPAGGDKPAPAPEPWTPERVTEWNAYYDLYVMLGVLLLVFLASANRISLSNSSLWTRLQVGRAIAEKGSPVLKDSFSYTEEGASWVNVPWLFDWSHAAAYKAAYSVSPFDPIDRTASAARGEQVAAGTLVALDALARLLTALVLLGVRRAGPGRWWSAACVALALGAVINPAGVLLGGGVQIGGVAEPGAVAPPTWGLLLLAVEVWLIHRAVDLGRGRAAFALVPLFALWANVDESFLVGLLVLAAAVAGRMTRPKGVGPGGFGLPASLALLTACVAACLVNPSVALVYRAAAEPFAEAELFRSRASADVLTPDKLSYFGSTLREQTRETAGAYPVIVSYYLCVVAVGFASFALNRRRFSPGRFLMYGVAAVLWGLLKRFAPEFSVVFAATLALNGQEWYQDRFGTAGRVGSGWSAWSVGGRAVTILVLFLCVVKVLLGGLPIPGFGAAEGDPQFGFGYERDDFAFEAADFLKGAPIRGNVLNTTKSEGDALVWRAYPERRAYIDNRRHLFPPDIFRRLQETRLALSADDVAAWKPLLDRYNVTAVMIGPTAAPKTYQALSRSKNWVLFYDDGAAVMFGRADAPKDDLAFFEANRLEPELAAYKRNKPSPPSDRPPSPVTWIDSLFQSRALARPQPHTDAARRWLATPDALTPGGSPPDPARCLLAVREARAALASKPDDNQAFRLLAVAYRRLMVQETALLAGIALTPENADRVARLDARPNLIPARYRELVTALNYAIQTTPPPRSRQERRDLQAMNMELFRVYLAGNSLDLARDRLQAVLDKADPGDIAPEVRAQLARDMADLNDRVKQIEEQLSTAATEQSLAPVQLARFAMNQGAPGLAAHELEEAERTGTNPALVKPQLLDLYCDTGQPDKAIEMLSSGTIDDPSFGSEPGASAVRQARVYYLLGNTEYAGRLWEQYAIPRARQYRTVTALLWTQSFLKGDVRPATSHFLEIPAKIREQADWEFEAALCRLEGGTPSLAAEHFTKALTLSPNTATRPIIAYYLEKLGQPVPPPDEPTKDAKTPAAEKGKGGEKATAPVDRDKSGAKDEPGGQAKPEPDKPRTEEAPGKSDEPRAG